MTHIMGLLPPASGLRLGSSESTDTTPPLTCPTTTQFPLRMLSCQVFFPNVIRGSTGKYGEVSAAGNGERERMFVSHELVTTTPQHRHGLRGPELAVSDTTIDTNSFPPGVLYPWTKNLSYNFSAPCTPPLPRFSSGATYRLAAMLAPGPAAAAAVPPTALPPVAL